MASHFKKLNLLNNPNFFKLASCKKYSPDQLNRFLNLRSGLSRHFASSTNGLWTSNENVRIFEKSLKALFSKYSHHDLSCPCKLKFISIYQEL